MAPPQPPTRSAALLLDRPEQRRRLRVVDQDEVVQERNVRLQQLIDAASEPGAADLQQAGPMEGFGGPADTVDGLASRGLGVVVDALGAHRHDGEHEASLAVGHSGHGASNAR